MRRKDEQLPLYDSRDAGVVYSAACVLPGVIALFFSVALIAAGAAGETDADWYKYCSYLIPQAGFFAVLLLFSAWKKQPVARGLAPYKFPPRYLGAVLLLSAGTLFGLGWLNELFIGALRDLGYAGAAISVPNMEHFWQYALCLVVIAVLPALFEEAIFRGVMLQGMRGMGTTATVLLSGALFSLFHQNPQQTPYQFVCGAMYALVALRAGSVLPTVILHFVNNAFILTLSYAAGADFAFSPAAEWALTGVGLACFLVAAVWLIFLDGKREEKRESPARFLLFASLGIVYSALMWIVGLFA